MRVPLIDEDLAKAAGGPTLNLMDIARQTPGPIFVLRHLGEDRVVVHGVDLRRRAVRRHPLRQAPVPDPRGDASYRRRRPVHCTQR